MAEKRLRTDLMKIHTNPPPGVSAAPLDCNIFSWNALITGPENTPFEGGTFKLRLEFTKDYPNQAPKVWFFSKMFHPNVYRNGRICLDILEEPDKWSKDFDVGGVLAGIQAMLGDPNPESPANSEANSLFVEQRELYEQMVRQDIVERVTKHEDEEDDEGEDINENLETSKQIEEMEERMSLMAIRELTSREQQEDEIYWDAD